MPIGKSEGFYIMFKVLKKLSILMITTSGLMTSINIAADDKISPQVLEITDFIKELEKLNTKTLRSCQEVNMGKEEPVTIGCTAPKNDDVKIVKLDFKSPKDVPKKLSKKITEYSKNKIKLDKEPDRPISIMLTLHNDNIGALSYINSTPDDFGFTHGTEIQVGKELFEGYKFTLNFVSNVYTEQIGVVQKDGSLKQIKVEDRGTVRKTKQHFTNETIAELLVESLKKGDGWTWQGSLGWRRLSSNSKGNILEASRHQDSWHKAINKKRPGMAITPINVSNGKPNRYGMFASFFGIYTKTILSGGKCEIKAKLKPGIIADSSTNKIRFVVDTKGSVKLFLFKKKLGLGLDLGSKITAHSQGVEVTPEASINVGTKRFETGLKANQPMGNVFNDVDYNLPNLYEKQRKVERYDSIGSLYFKVNW